MKLDYPTSVFVTDCKEAATADNRITKVKVMTIFWENATDLKTAAMKAGWTEEQLIKDFDEDVLKGLIVTLREHGGLTVVDHL